MIAFRLSGPDLIPEGIAYDSVSESFFVSSVYLAKVVRFDKSTGDTRDFIAERGHEFGSGLGMAVDPGSRTLWAASSTTSHPSKRQQGSLVR